MTRSAPANPTVDKQEASSAHHTSARVVDSQTLLQGQSMVFIRHQGELYRLQATRQGKLILTK
jgi:hemin uptake protein HemP